MRAGRALRYAGGLALGIALFARAADRPSADLDKLYTITIDFLRRVLR